MSVESPPSALKLNFGLIARAPKTPIHEIPPHLTREILQKRQRVNGVEDAELRKLWEERGLEVEEKVRSIIASQTEIVKRVITNPKPDTEGPDLTVELNGGMIVCIEVKSSTLGVNHYKKHIRESLPEGQRDAEHVTKWMTENNIILINGGEKDDKEKTWKEILEDSFYPQLERIIQRNLRRQIPEPSGQMALLPKPEQMPEGFGQIVLFPEIQKQIQVFPKHLPPLVRKRGKQLR